MHEDSEEYMHPLIQSYLSQSNPSESVSRRTHEYRYSIKNNKMPPELQEPIHKQSKFGASSRRIGKTGLSRIDRVREQAKEMRKIVRTGNVLENALHRFKASFCEDCEPKLLHSFHYVAKDAALTTTKPSYQKYFTIPDENTGRSSTTELRTKSRSEDSAVGMEGDLMPVGTILFNIFGRRKDAVGLISNSMKLEDKLRDFVGLGSNDRSKKLETSNVKEEARQERVPEKVDTKNNEKSNLIVKVQALLHDDLKVTMDLFVTFKDKKLKLKGIFIHAALLSLDMYFERIKLTI